MKKVGRKSQKSKLKSKTKRKITTKQTTLNTVASDHDGNISPLEGPTESPLRKSTTKLGRDPDR